jgi:hypothetical protein
MRFPLAQNGWASAWLPGLLLLAIFLIRAAEPGQPIVENYVGRQVPTAMVARNLERGSGMLWPQLDTAPFPNYFLVEPPLYQCCVVFLRRATGIPLETAGRILSALMMALGGWGLFELARRRDGWRVALLAVAAFAFFPLTIRYGRAFQPDASMLGVILAGLACWDTHQSTPRWYWLAAGWCFLALGFALKITSAFILIPLSLLFARPGRISKVVAAFSTLIPVLLWYAWAEHLIGRGAGSRAAADNRSIWIGLVGAAGIRQVETLRVAAWFLLVRAFTPLGAGLAVFGLWIHRGRPARRDWFWPVWGISGLFAMALLAEKLHHEYYWLMLAPVAAVGVGRALDRLVGIHRALALATAAAFVLLCWGQVRSTWRSPSEWNELVQAGRVLASTVPGDSWIAAPEALLFQADRRGCRMEWTSSGARRAAREWGTKHEVANPTELIEFYRQRGARYFADVGSRDAGSRRKGLHDAVRRRYKVIVDLPEIIIADLADSGMHWNAN